MAIEIESFLASVAEAVRSRQVPVVDLIAVQSNDPFKVLVATILSARTRDEMTARAAARLFARAQDADALATLSEEEIASLIRPVGFFRTKAGHLFRLPTELARFGGQVPESIEELLTLPGVGRKTANLVMAMGFGKAAICVDTHVHRIMNIWGYVATRTPLQTEMALREKLPVTFWREVNGLLVAFGQSICRPIGPHCDCCPLGGLCPQLGVRPRRPPGAKMDPQRPLKFVSWNVNGIRAIEKKGFVDILLSFDADLIAVQETKAQPEQLSEQLKNIPGYTSYWHSAERKGYSGVAWYSRLPPLAVHYGLGEREFDCEGRLLTLEFAPCFLLCCYFPNSGEGLKRLDFKLRFNDRLLTYLQQLEKKKPVILCGDYNVAHREIDLKNPAANVKNAGFTPEERAWMDRFLDNGYVDCFRMFNNEPEQYTWWSYRFNARAKNIGWRIDYFCVSAAAREKVRNAAILAEVTGSDHCPVTLEYLC